MSGRSPRPPRTRALLGRALHRIATGVFSRDDARARIELGLFARLACARGLVASDTELAAAGALTGPEDAGHAEGLLERTSSLPAGGAGLGELDLSGAAPESLGVWHTELLSDRGSWGAYYTPAPLARAMAEAALDALPGDPPPLILDPACGGGALLLGVARALRARGVEVDPCRLFGADLDAGAARAARRALALELLSPGDAPLDLGGQVVEGDALDDFASFPWEQGSFDAVVVNPPYAPPRQPPYIPQLVREYEARMEGLRARFGAASYKLDAYPLFMERSVGLVREGGVAVMLTPNTFQSSTHGEPLRRWLLDHVSVLTLDELDWAPFGGVRVDLALTTARRVGDEQARARQVVCMRERSRCGGVRELGRVPQGSWSEAPGGVFSNAARDDEDVSCERMDEVGVPLGEIASAYFGLQTRGRGAYVRGDAPDQTWAPCVDGAHVQRYRLLEPEEFVSTSPEAVKSGGDPEVHGRDRILVRQIGKRPVAALAPGGVWALNTLYNVWLEEGSGYELRELLGLLLSEPIGRYWERRFWDRKRTFPKVKKASLLALPMPPRVPENEARFARLVEIVDALVAEPEGVGAPALERERDVLVESMYGG